MLSTLKPRVEKNLRFLTGIFKNVNPNIISLTGLLFPVLFFLCLVNKLYPLALAVFVFNGFDLVDGLVARAYGKVTAFGGFLDSTIDRFADFTVIAAFGFAHLVIWNWVLPLLLLSFLISYIRSRTELAAKGHLTAAVGLIERPERLVAVFVGLLLYACFSNTDVAGQNIPTVTFIVLIILSSVTIVQRVAFAYKNLEQ
jgi:archaetidylinositol phosphate synthase